MHCEDTTHFVEDCRGIVRQCEDCHGYACELTVSFHDGRWLCTYCYVDYYAEAELVA